MLPSEAKLRASLLEGMLSDDPVIRGNARYALVEFDRQMKSVKPVPAILGERVCHVHPDQILEPGNDGCDEGEIPLQEWTECVERSGKDAGRDGYARLHFVPCGRWSCGYEGIIPKDDDAYDDKE